MPSDPKDKKSPTFAELIAEGKLPGGKLEDVLKEPEPKEPPRRMPPSRYDDRPAANQTAPSCTSTLPDTGYSDSNCPKVGSAATKMRRERH